MRNLYIDIILLFLGNRRTVVLHKYHNTPRHKVTLHQRHIYSRHHFILTVHPNPLIRRSPLNMPLAIQHRRLKRQRHTDIPTQATHYFYLFFVITTEQNCNVSFKYNKVIILQKKNLTVYSVERNQVSPLKVLSTMFHPQPSSNSIQLTGNNLVILFVKPPNTTLIFHLTIIHTTCW